MSRLVYEDVVERCRSVHGDRYEYPVDMLERMDKTRKVPIVCPLHGEFWQILGNHYKGCGCTECGGNDRKTNEEYVDGLRGRFGDLFIYDSVKYVNNHTPIMLGCSKHGYFSIIPSKITDGLSCPKCKKEDKVNPYRKDTVTFISQAVEKHGDKYDYSRTKYTTAKEKLCIVCPKHGEFWQLPNNHLKGEGCPKCKAENVWANREKMSNEEFVEEANLVHCGKYGYSDVSFVNKSSKVSITCPEHGNFLQTPYMHLKGQGCPKCKMEVIKGKLRLTTEEFVDKAKSVHGERYDYSKVEYVNYHTKVCIVCSKHGEFWQTPYCHLNCNGCPTCKGEMSVSRQETELGEYVKSLCGFIETNNRQIISPLELDIYLPFHNVAIEYDGLYWHSTSKVDKDYHLRKTEECEKKGIKLVHIFEDEWTDRKEIVKSKLKRLLGMSDNVIEAEETEVVELVKEDALLFLEENHLDGGCEFDCSFGLMHEGKLVSVMCLRETDTQGKYTIERFCDRLNTIVNGGLKKMLEYFSQKQTVSEFVVKVDRRFDDSEFYEDNGFGLVCISEPSCFYVVNNRRKSISGSLVIESETRPLLYDCGHKEYSKSF